MQKDIQNINFVLNEVVKYFEPKLTVQLVYSPFRIEYYHSKKKDRTGYYPVYSIDLKVVYDGIDLDTGEENHLTVLNEAKLSALAISIYLSALIVTPQANMDYKILFMDDIFIGLDMSNRIPLIKIATEFKKPIIEQFVNEGGQITERIREINGVKQTETLPFFKSYQIFITTYDRNWFETAKYLLKETEWTSIEMYAANEESETKNPVVISPSLNYYEKAVAYYKKGTKDYQAAGNYLRKEYERVLKELLYGKYLLNSSNKTGETWVIEELGDLWDSFYASDACLLKSLDFEKSVYHDFNVVSKTVLNPLSHDNLAKPIYKSELQLAFDLLNKLKSIQKEVLIPAKSILTIQTNNDGVTRTTFIKLLDEAFGYKQIFIKADGSTEIKTNITAFRVKPVKYEQGGLTTDLSHLKDCDLDKAFNMVYHHVFGIKDASAKLKGFNKYDEFVDTAFGCSLQFLIDNM